MKNYLTTMMAGAATVAVVATGSALTAAPAEALEIVPGDRLVINGDVTVSRTAEEGTFSFTDFKDTRITASSSTPPFLEGSSVTIANFLASTTTGSIIGTPFLPFISNIQLTDGTTAVFNLLDSSFRLTIDRNQRVFDLDLLGEFVAGNTVLGDGRLSTQIRVNNLGTSTAFSADLQAVPTPAAVLPGLLGMGAAAFRKKKQEDEGEVSLETADANA